MITPMCCPVWLWLLEGGSASQVWAVTLHSVCMALCTRGNQVMPCAVLYCTVLRVLWHGSRAERWDFTHHQQFNCWQLRTAFNIC
jgi:hypothetical protein